MDSRLSHMGVDPHQYRNALRETNERNRVYKEKFCYVWYGVCLVSLLVLVVGLILTAAGAFGVCMFITIGSEGRRERITALSRCWWC